MLNLDVNELSVRAADESQAIVNELDRIATVLSDGRLEEARLQADSKRTRQG